MLDFLSGTDPVLIAQRLLGVEIVSRVNGVETVGKITETEAYWAPDDQASHAKNGRRTPRTATFYAPPGTAYVYLCYGIHELFNVVTGPEEVPHAILIRAVEPLAGVETMLGRRKLSTLKPQLTAGPGVLSKALGINRSHNGIDLLSGAGELFLRVTSPPPKTSEIVATPRIGIGYAGPPWTEKPWRFYLRGNRFVSRLNAFS